MPRRSGAIVGDNISFAIGHFLGARVERRFFSGEKAQKRLKWAQRTLDERGGYLIVVARFIPGGRTVDDVHRGLRRDVPLAPLPRCSTRSRARSGARYTVLLGYFGGRTFEEQPWKGLLLAFAIALAVTGVVEVVRYLRHRRARA